MNRFVRYLLLALFLGVPGFLLLSSGPHGSTAQAGPLALPQDSAMYRTGSYLDWADAVDQKDKRKAVKPKPDKVDFSFTLPVPVVPDPGTSLLLKFGEFVDPVTIWSDTLKTTTIFSGSGPSKQVGPITGIVSGTTILVEGRGLKGKTMKVSYSWDHPSNKIKGKVTNVANTLRLPMPNLHNVGEGVFGGIAETPVELTIGAPADPKGAHTVYLRKYKDALKTLVKEKKGGDIHHDAPPRWLDTFDKNGKPILKAQKGLPPDKHNNSLLGEQLALKLNIAASDSGFFPAGLGDLIYSNSTPYDGMSVWQIALHVDTFLTHGNTQPDTLALLQAVHDINVAFAGDMDTVSWSGGNVICTGVKMLIDVPYLFAPPAGAPEAFHPGSPVVHAADGPSVFRLEQNYPNPFNPTTTIEFELPADALVSVLVYNTLGQEVALLADQEPFDEGMNDLNFDASTIPSGVYFYRIIAQDVEGVQAPFTTVKKMVLIK